MPKAEHPMKRRKVIVHIATSADGYIARCDGDLDWLTSRPAPKGFYGMNAFMRSVDTMLLGRKTYDGAVARSSPRFLTRRRSTSSSSAWSRCLLETAFRS